LPEIGFKVLPGQGTYFMIADIRPLLPPGSKDTDVDFCQKLTEDVGVTLIPVRPLVVHSGAQARSFRVRVTGVQSHRRWLRRCSRVLGLAQLVARESCFSLLSRGRMSRHSKSAAGSPASGDESKLLL